MDRVSSTADYSFTASEREKIVARCLEALGEEEACAVSDPDLIDVLHWIGRGAAGQRLTIVSIVCPDYAVEATEGGQFRYTFGAIHSGIGIAGRRIYRSMSALYALFRERLALPNLTYQLYVADFEGFSEENLRRVGITAAEFAVKVRGQRDALEQQAPVPVTVRLFSECCAGKAGWLKELEKMRLRLDSAALSDSQLIREIAHERGPLYRQWFGDEHVEDGLLELLVTLQASEYATVGDIVARNSSNPLMIVAGSEKVSQFYGLATRMPILCLKAKNI